jgi:hexosaminidase
MQMKTRITGVLLSLLAATALAQAASGPDLVPLPQKMELKSGSFTLTAGTTVTTDAASQATGAYLAEQLRQPTGFALKTATATSSAKGTIFLTTANAKTDLGTEGYELTVTPDGIVIRAPEQAGLFYGVQTLLQLLPPQVYSRSAVSGVAWTAPAVQIEDQPRFHWRGLMLDVSRHFYNKAEVKRLLELMAANKINVFHWHLVDDPGWRIEIKKYPKLTEVAGWRDGIDFGLDPKSSTAYGPDGRYGGFYTQDDIREIVAYATSLHITVVPEIEMPGHSGGALRARQDLGCSGKNTGVYCAGNEDTFVFLQDVLTEVFALFPSQYIHIGGDEVDKTAWHSCPKCQARMKAEGLKSEHELQSYFIRRIEKFINANHRDLLGWSEIREGGLAANATVMDWIGGGKEAAAEGHKVVMSPTGFCYFDYFQSQDTASEPRAIGGFLPLQKVYSFEPIPDGLPKDKESLILGGQGNVWTEFIASFKHVQYMTFPRLTALAEVTWSPKETRNWDNFKRRLQTQYKRFDVMEVNCRRDNTVEVGSWKPADVKTTGVELTFDVTRHITAAGHCRVSLNYTEGAHGLQLHWVALLEDGKEIGRDTHNGFTGASPKNTSYGINLPAWKAGATYTIKAQVASDGGTDSHGVVVLEFKPAK